MWDFQPGATFPVRVATEDPQTLMIARGLARAGRRPPSQQLLRNLNGSRNLAAAGVFSALSNSPRSWFVTAPFVPGNIHSRTVHERVAAALTIAASSPTGDTSHPIVFTGAILPSMIHVGEHVFLQAQEGLGGDDWRTLKGGVIDSSSDDSIPYRFRVPGEYELRVLFSGDDRNISAYSDTSNMIRRENEARRLKYLATIGSSQ